MLYIYRASAGSGKTHLLSGFFIELLFKSDKTPSLQGRDLQFDEVLAVTFTNKATAEMKHRIIEEIYTLSRDPQKSAYYNKLKEPDSKGKVMSDETIRKRAHAILTQMLNNYSDLHISTIDSFFQQIIRSFARELNLQGNYEIELNKDMVMEHAVSEFLLGLNEKEDKDTFDWMLDFSKGRMQEGSDWNTHEELLKLTKVLTTEEYRKNADKIREFTSDRKRMNEYIRCLRQVIKDWKEEIVKIGERGKKAIEKLGLPLEDYASKGGAFKKFGLWADGDPSDITDTFIKWADDPTEWFNKKDKHKADELDPDSRDAMLQTMQEAVEHLNGEPLLKRNTAQVILDNFYQLGIISRLDKSVDDYCTTKGVKLISNTTQLLNALIGKEDSPFIYEKTGTRIQSFMIDEFQDTSGMQWENFMPLLTNSLGTNNENLIVGDVKQSIYRWRGGDWELLNSHINSFMPKLQHYDENHNHLKDNWRSDRGIIRFNNEFFKFASKALSESDSNTPELRQIADIYSDVEQFVSADRVKMYQEHKHADDVPEGFVHFEQLSHEDGAEAMAEAMERLPKVVMALQDKGFKAKNILILCRKRLQCIQCAETLLAYKKNHPDTKYVFDIITSEALKLGSRKVIQMLVNMLHALHEPKSDYRRFVASCSWMVLHGISMSQAIERYMNTQESPDIEELLNQPLYEIVERLMGLLPKEVLEQDATFLQAFRDCVLEFCAKEGPSLDAFLRWWDEHGSDTSVNTPEDQNAIRIMTIHKSKGLGEDAVIVPYASQILGFEAKHKNTIWCQPKGEPFEVDGLIVPVSAGNKMRDSYFHKEYSEELLRAYIDNLNTIYVAFTRAKHALVIMAPAAKKSGQWIENHLANFALTYERFDNLKITDEAAESVSQKAEANPEPSLAFITDTTPRPAPEIMIKRTDYNPDEGPIAIGNTIHNALSAVKDLSDIDGPIRQLFESGRAEAKGLSLDETLQTVHEILARPDVATWFDPKNTVFNERNIITTTTHTQRPDRIVITPEGKAIIVDYKTGEEDASKHHKQVAYYMTLLKRIGFKSVEGYLWYITPHKIVSVDDPAREEQK